MKLTEVIKVWDLIHHMDVGDLGFCDLEKALDKVVGVENDVPGCENQSDEPDPPLESHSKSGFERELRGLINTHSIENASNTPDFILAQYLTIQLEVFAEIVDDREVWHGRERAKECGREPIQLEPTK